MRSPLLRRRLLTAAPLVLLLALAACGGPPQGAAAGGPTITARNCGIDVTVPGPPQQVYAAYQPAIEMAHALGLGKRIVATAFLDAEVLPEYAAAQATTNYLPELPGREALLAAHPDFVLSGFNGVFADSAAGDAGFGTRASLRELGVQTWVFGPLCPSADGKTDEAIDPASVRMENVYTDVRDLGRLFGVEERATALVADMHKRIAAVQQKVAGAPRPKVAIVSPQDDGSFRTAGGPDFVTQILDMAGAENAFGDLTGKRNFPLSVEALIARNPDVILTSTCCDGSYTRATAEPDAAKIRNNPAFANLTAVRGGQVHPFLFADRAAGVRVPHAVELVASIVHPDRK